MQSFNSFDSGSQLVKISGDKSQRDKSKSQLRRISNSIYLNETKFKFDPDYYKKINEKYQILSNQNFKKVLQVQQGNALQYRYKPKVDLLNRTMEKGSNTMQQKFKMHSLKPSLRPRISFDRVKKDYEEKTLVTSPSKRRVLVQLQLQAANALRPRVPRSKIRTMGISEMPADVAATIKNVQDAEAMRAIGNEIKSAAQ